MFPKYPPEIVFPPKVVVSPEDFIFSLRSPGGAGGGGGDLPLLKNVIIFQGVQF